MIVTLMPLCCLCVSTVLQSHPKTIHLLTGLHTVPPTHTIHSCMQLISIHTQMQTHTQFKDYFYPDKRVMQIMTQGRKTLRWIKTHEVIVTWCPLGQQYTPHLHFWQSHSLAAIGKNILMFSVRRI